MAAGFSFGLPLTGRSGGDWPTGLLARANARCDNPLWQPFGILACSRPNVRATARDARLSGQRRRAGRASFGGCAAGLEARAIFEGREQEACWRARRTPLHRSRGRRMTRGANRADGFRIMKGEGLPFIRSPRMRPMCAPPLRGTIDEAGLIVTVQNRLPCISNWQRSSPIWAFIVRAPMDLVEVHFPDRRVRAVDENGRPVDLMACFFWIGSTLRCCARLSFVDEAVFPTSD